MCCSSLNCNSSSVPCHKNVAYDPSFASRTDLNDIMTTKKDVPKFIVPVASQFTPYEYREEEGNYKSGEYAPWKFFDSHFLLGVYVYLPNGIFQVNFDHATKKKDARPVTMEAGSNLPSYPSERSIGGSTRDLIVPLAVVEVMVPANNVLLPPMEGNQVLYALPVNQPSSSVPVDMPTSCKLRK